MKALTATALEVSYHHIALPRTNLHYLKCGVGPPLVVVPATISEIDNWLGLAQFMGQWFTTYFFELPGHGQSTPFAEGYSADRTAQTVEDFLDALGHRSFTLMGFSFGGILALKTLYRLNARVERVILFAPCATQSALKYAPARLWLLRRTNALMHRAAVQRWLLNVAHDEAAVEILVRALRKLGRLEANMALREKLLGLPDSTLEVLTGQIEEILTCEFEKPAERFQQPCLLGMSPYDPLLDFEITRACLEERFANLTAVRFPFHYHQPPRPLTFAELNRDAGNLVQAWAQGRPPGLMVGGRPPDPGRQHSRPAPADLHEEVLSVAEGL